MPRDLTSSCKDFGNAAPQTRARLIDETSRPAPAAASGRS
jgi:hypothetical protein